MRLLYLSCLRASHDIIVLMSIKAQFNFLTVSPLDTSVWALNGEFCTYAISTKISCAGPISYAIVCLAVL